jgi:orotidine-5'-phosphate decarboxylase
MEAKERIIFAADVNNLDDLERYVSVLSGHIGVVKLGKEILTTAMLEGLPVIQTVLDNFEGEIMIDLKLNDIPRTVAGASKVIARQPRIFGFTVHCLGGREMLEQAVKAVDSIKDEYAVNPLVLGVTILTSLDKEALRHELGIRRTPKNQVKLLASLAREAGVPGIVCSPLETKEVLKVYPDCIVVNPGIRFAGFDTGDQKRVSTPYDAIRNGASYIVMGSELRKEDPVGVANRAAEEIEMALREISEHST